MDIREALNIVLTNSIYSDKDYGMIKYRNFEIEDPTVEDIMHSKDLLYDVLINILTRNMNCCGCGNPDIVLDIIYKYLKTIENGFDNMEEKINNIFDDYIDAYDEDEVFNNYNSPIFALLEFLMYQLESYGFTDHGSVVTYSWPTDLGKAYIVIYEYWYNFNKNLRVYDEETIKQALNDNKLLKSLLDGNNFLGELDHPKGE